MIEELPIAWAAAKLNEIVDSALGGDWGEDPDELIDGMARVRVIRGTDFKNWRTDKGTSAAERCIKVASLGKRRLQKNDLVLEVSGGGPQQPVGRTVLIDDDAIERADAPLVCSNFFRLLRLHPGIDAQYISHFLSYAYARGDFNEFQTDTTNLRNLNVTDFLEHTEVPLAPFAEQQRIKAKLGSVLGTIDGCADRLAKIQIILRRFRQSILAAACSGRLTADWREEHPDVAPYIVDVEQDIEADPNLPDHWALTRLGTLTTLATSGSRGWAKYYADSGSTFIRAQNINSDFLNLHDIAFVRPPKSAEGLRTKVQRYDILITITGANVTKAAIVENQIDDAYVSQHVALVRLQDVHLSRFLFHYIVSPTHGRLQLQAAAYGQGKPGLNLDNIRDVLVTVPPLPEQQEIVRRVDALTALADRLEGRLLAAQRQVQSLKPSLLAKAFRGELVPTESDLAEAEGREFESGEQLLARVRREREMKSHATNARSDAIQKTRRRPVASR